MIIYFIFPLSPQWVINLMMEYYFNCCVNSHGIEIIFKRLKCLHCLYSYKMSLITSQGERIRATIHMVENVENAKCPLTGLHSEFEI